MNKTNYFYLVILVCGILSCSKRSKNDTVPNSQIPESLSKVIALKCICSGALDEYIFKNQTVWVEHAGGPACDVADLIVYYYADGTSIPSKKAGFTYEQFLQEAHFVKNLYNCSSYSATDSTKN